MQNISRKDAKPQTSSWFDTRGLQGSIRAHKASGFGAEGLGRTGVSGGTQGG